MWHPNSNQHKAKHGGYRQKPTQAGVNAQLGMLAAIAAITKTNAIHTPVKVQPGVQLKIKF